MLILAACSSQPATPAGLTADDQAMLNDAGTMLADNGLTPDAVFTNESTLP